MHSYKRGKVHSSPKHKKVKSRKQAITIGLSKVRKKGAKVPKKAESRQACVHSFILSSPIASQDWAQASQTSVQVWQMDF
ncbi:DUF6496 domain-containing protein [Candidatus Coxiella mudrowiae]|uniref:Uncharacterized protein n=1 Tax=Candidatus Coxiella mudrowiae TaxID=2054173 RepID=A0ABM5UVU4_9COXI|nr:DUF6496 domain-containing protein [Candidatus Coxiella mudrowiae]AKQ34025.1 Uncharacterized protein CleRT_15720 [Candidatus Coxiella mudrowiae]